MAKDTLSSTLFNLSQLVDFCFAFADELPNQQKNFKKGQDISAYLKESSIQIPELLQDESIVWLGGADARLKENDDDTRSITIVRPGNPTALGLTLGCIRFGRFRVCLECGWLYCRIVIKGRF